MELTEYIGIAVGVVVYVGVRIYWRRKTYADILGRRLSRYGCELVRVRIPKFYETGPFPKVAVRTGAKLTKIAGMDTTHFAYRIVTFRDGDGNEHTRWVRLLLNPFGVQEIIWEPGTTELPDAK